MSFLPWSKISRPWEPIAEELLLFASRTKASHGIVNPWELAPKFGLRVLPCDFDGLSDLEKAFMRSGDQARWSGGVLPAPLPDGSVVCMLNPFQTVQRQKITLMEEIVHRYRGHAPTQLFDMGNGRYRDFDKSQEEEAYGVGAAVLLPWRRFFPLLNQGVDRCRIAEIFEVTQDLVSYRIKICGASALYRRRQIDSLSATA